MKIPQITKRRLQNSYENYLKNPNEYSYSSFMRIMIGWNNKKRNGNLGLIGKAEKRTLKLYKKMLLDVIFLRVKMTFALPVSSEIVSSFKYLLDQKDANRLKALKSFLRSSSSLEQRILVAKILDDQFRIFESNIDYKKMTKPLKVQTVKRLKGCLKRIDGLFAEAEFEITDFKKVGNKALSITFKQSGSDGGFKEIRLHGYLTTVFLEILKVKSNPFFILDRMVSPGKLVELLGMKGGSLYLIKRLQTELATCKKSNALELRSLMLNKPETVINPIGVLTKENKDIKKGKKKSDTPLVYLKWKLSLDTEQKIIAAYIK